MKGKKGYPVTCKSKDTVIPAAKQSQTGAVHGKPLFSAAGPGGKKK
jgi:hypothetical protein